MKWYHIVGVLAIVGAILAGWSWAFSSPLTSSPDDDYHQTSIWCPPPVSESGCTVEYDDEGSPVGVFVPQIVQAPTCYAFLTHESAACTRDLDPDLQVLSTRFDQGDYPGPYYRFMNVFVGTDPTWSILVMRGFNVVLATALLAAIALVMRSPGQRILILATLATVVPLGMFIIASVNPSSWAFTGVTGTWLAVHAALSSRDSRWRVIVASLLAVLSATIAAVARADAGAYIVVVTAAIALVHWRALLRYARYVLPPLVIIAAIGLWSFLFSGQSGVLGVTTEPGGRSPLDVLFYNLMEFPGFVAGVFGVNWGLGWLDTRSHALTYVSATIVAGALVITGLRVVRLGKLLGLLLVFGTLLALPLFVHQSQLIVIGEGIQPRYLLPLLPAVVGIALVGAAPDRSVGLSASQTGLVYFMLVAANSAGLHANIRRYVTGQDVWSFFLGRQAEWWWDFGPKPLWLWLIGSVSFALAALALFLVIDSRPWVDDAPTVPALPALRRARHAPTAGTTGQNDQNQPLAPPGEL